MKKLLLIEYDDDYDIISPIKLKRNHKPNNKELRLGIDLINDMYPLFKKDYASKPDFLRDILNFEVSEERLARLLTHKQILFKQVITIKNNKVIIKKVRKF